MNYKSIFPYPEIREQQKEAIDFSIKSLLDDEKRFVIIEAGTGVGKSAIGYTVANYVNRHMSAHEKFVDGSLFVTTQKILQDQYIKDFSTKGMKSIKSSSNYMCSYKKGNTCADSGKELRVEDKSTKFYKACTFNCVYRKSKESFLSSKNSVTNFPYMLTEATYSKGIKPRNLLVIDEAHNAESELSKFVEITVTDRFAKSMLKLRMPYLKTQYQAYAWIKDTYFPKLESYKKHVTSMMEKYSGLKSKLKDFVTLARQLELLDGHHAKIKRFLEIYDSDNWVFEVIEADGRKGKRLQFKPIDVSPYSEDILFRLGRKIVMMSATILDKDGFCKTLGIDPSQAAFISLASPFPTENRPIFSFSIGKMSFKEIDKTLPKLAEAIESILEQHKNEKGIIHAHSYKIANYLKRNIKSRRILIHDSTNREEVLSKHLTSNKPTVLLSPSMTEGVDLVDEASRFQVVCKVPYPYLGDKLVKKRMNKWKWWYPLQTAKTIVQSVGRSVRSGEDHAVTYILDSDWGYFYSRNKQYFPEGFKSCLKK
tara:strand:+ start:1900 stop:3513 length:1614 start_codon:yes stop_codon:yes gene_type:complete